MVVVRTDWRKGYGELGKLGAAEAVEVGAVAAMQK